MLKPLKAADEFCSSKELAIGLPKAESYEFDHTDETIWIRTERMGNNWVDSDSTQTITYENWASGLDETQEPAYIYKVFMFPEHLLQYLLQIRNFFMYLRIDHNNLL